VDFEEDDSREPATLLFATIPFRYLSDTSAEWARRGVDGFILSGIMRNWDSDVWATDGGRVVGESNPLFSLLKEMNRTCRENGVDRNFIKVAFYTHLPDWFDDEGWDILYDRFRQGAAFARGTSFQGMAIDIEYISEIYELSWKGYRKEGYPVKKLRRKAFSRGREIVRSMLEEYPSMEVLLLPQGPECYGELASDLFSGMLAEMSDRRAPGGLHLLTEATYLQTEADWLLRYGQQLDEIVEGVAPDEVWPYWRERCSISYGLWPLGYYREIFDDRGQFLGYGGKRESFGDEPVGSYADKSENYGVEEFRRQLAASRMVCKRYVWIYCHGSTFWHLNEAQMKKYGGNKSDSLPVVPNLTEYLGVLGRREIIADPSLRRAARDVRHGVRRDFLTPMGSPSEWNVIGPFGNENGVGFSAEYPPEREVDLKATYVGAGVEARWARAKVFPTGFMDLARIFRPPDYRCAYALCYARTKRDHKARILFGSDDGAKIWVGGEQVFAVDAVRGAEPDDDTVDVVLPRGTVPILLKITNHKGAWGFYFRMTDQKGKCIKGLSWFLSPASD